MAAGPDVTSYGSGSGAGVVPVVPGRLALFGHTMSLLGRPFRFLSSLRSHGEVVRIYLGPLPVYVVTSPELAWQVLATKADSFDKGMVFDKVRPLFGNGLANSNGDFYRRQRRLVQPAFHRKHIAGYVHTMAWGASDLVGPGGLVRSLQWTSEWRIWRSPSSGELSSRPSWVGTRSPRSSVRCRS